MEVYTDTYYMCGQDNFAATITHSHATLQKNCHMTNSYVDKLSQTVIKLHIILVQINVSDISSNVEIFFKNG